MRIRARLAAVLLGTAMTLGGLGSAQALEVGQKAPDFSLPAPGGKTVKLADLLGKGPVVIYTFIQAFTGV